MAKKKPKPPEGESVPQADTTKKPNRTGVPLHIWIPPSYRETLDQLAEENRRALTTEVLIALEQHFIRLGKWTSRPSP